MNGLCVDNVTYNRRFRKKASKTYAKVVSGTPNTTDLNVEMKDTKINEVPHKNKEGIILTSIFENLLRDNSSIPQETLLLLFVLIFVNQLICLMYYVHEKI